MRTLKVVLWSLMAVNVMVFVAALLVALFPGVVLAQAEMMHGGAAAASGASSEAGLLMIGSALAVGLGCVGAGIAVAQVGAAAVGAIAEKPDMLGKTLIFVGLAEGIAIYGLIISIMIYTKAG